MNRQILKQLPGLPGIYRYMDRNGDLLYIGKAKNLKNRVRSYFTPSAELSPAKQLMVSQINKIEYTVVTNETEALLLESTLINKYQPPFNIIFKDDKSWLYLKIIPEETFARIATARKILNDKAKYFGPYTSGIALRKTIRILKRIFPLLLTEKNFERYRIKQHQLLLNQKDRRLILRQTLDEVYLFLRGQTAKICQKIEQQMLTASKNKEFEKAGTLRDQLQAIKQIIQKQRVISARKDNQDYVHLFIDQAKQRVNLNLFKIREGKLLDHQYFSLANQEGFSPAEILEQFVNWYYAKTTDLPKELILPTKINPAILPYNFKITVPQIGRKKKILEMLLLNVKQSLEDKQASDQQKNDLNLANLKLLQQIISLKNLPQRIEAYDISNIQGKMAVGSMVVFNQGLPDKKEYRLFNIKTVKGPNDPAMIAEVIKRRFSHLNWPKPDLVLIDGGLTQLKAAAKNMPDLPLISLAKKQEEIYRLNRNQPLQFGLDSPALQLLQRLRDEAHRFAITNYKNKHRKLTKDSYFDSLNGLGPKTKKILLTEYDSLDEIRQAKEGDLIRLVGRQKTNIIKNKL
jgi:excinuclease ABC subunit C